MKTYEHLMLVLGYTYTSQGIFLQTQSTTKLLKSPFSWRIYVRFTDTSYSQEFTLKSVVTDLYFF